jgi:hypothetical protein
MEMMKEPEGPNFQLPVYTRRWKERDYYRIWLTDTGWYIAYMAHNGPSDPTGSPVLDNNFKQDSVAPVAGLGSEMQSLWHDARSGKLTRDQIQDGLNRIGNMIEESEKAPRRKSGRRGR